MSKNQTPEDQNRTIITYENEESEDSGTAELRQPPRSQAEATFRAAKEDGTPLHDEIYAIIEEHNQYARRSEDVSVIPRSIVDLPSMPSPKRTDEGRPYITDLNNVIRYFLDTGEVTMTDEFMQNARMVDCNERTNSFEGIYQVA